jgi:type I restriction enzyme M protein
MSYGDYVEQLTYLLFLKMDDEQVQLLGKPSAIPSEYGWQSLLGLHGDELESHYRHILAALGTGSGLTPVIFRKAQNRIQDPAKLRRLVELINGETWIGLDVDVKGSIYEGLLEKNAQDIKSGAGQYFTPRPLIQAIVDVMRPTPADTICDPAAGTCGFLLAAYDYILRHHHPLDRDQLDHVTHHALRGWEIVDNAARLGVMNLHLHGIGANAETSPIHVGDSLASDPGERFSLSRVAQVVGTFHAASRKASSGVKEAKNLWTASTKASMEPCKRLAAIRSLRRHQIFSTGLCLCPLYAGR